MVQPRWTQQGYEQGYQQPAASSQSPPPASTTPTGMAQSISAMEDIYIATDRTTTSNRRKHHDDSGAATHVCPPWFGTSFPLHQMKQPDKPILRKVTGTDIWVYGYRWIHFINQRGQHIMIPFYVCNVKQPILSVTRLIHQGFEINMSEQSTMTNPKSFESPVTLKHGLLYINLKLSPLPHG